MDQRIPSGDSTTPHPRIYNKVAVDISFTHVDGVRKILEG